MLTIFTIPKPFVDHIGVIQRNALASWARLGCQVILLGDEAGVEQAARQTSAQWVGEVNRNDFGTPLLSDAFARVAALSRHDWLCYVNADILLAPAFMDAFAKVKAQPCVVIGRRVNVDVAAPLDLAGDDWGGRLDELARSGQPGGIYAIDMLLFPRRDDLTVMPPFAVGRPGWDNWFVWRSRRLGLPLVDVSAVYRPIHQTHDYRHVPQASGDRWEGPEADVNRALMGSRHHMMDFRDVTHTLTPGTSGIPGTLGPSTGLAPVAFTRRLGRTIERFANRWLLWETLVQTAGRIRQSVIGRGRGEGR